MAMARFDVMAAQNGRPDRPKVIVAAALYQQKTVIYCRLVCTHIPSSWEREERRLRRGMREVKGQRTAEGVGGGGEDIRRSVQLVLSFPSVCSFVIAARITSESFSSVLLDESLT